MTERGSMIKRVVLALTSLVLLSIGWLQGSGVPLLIALVPLLIIEQSYAETRRRGWKIFGWCAIVFALWAAITTWWVGNSTIIGPIAILPVTATLFGSAFAIYSHAVRRVPRALAYTILAAAWISAEFGYMHNDVSFPWLNLGNGFANSIKLVQWYDTFGTYGGTLWVLLCNIMIFEAIRVWNSRRKWIVAGIVVILPIGASLVRYYTYKLPEPSVSISVVQPNIDPYLDKFNMSSEEQLKLFSELIMETPEAVDFIIFPETALQEVILENHIDNNSTIEELRELLRAERPSTQLVMGATTRWIYNSVADKSKTARVSSSGIAYDNYNSALAIDTSRYVDVYHKSVLVVAVEKMPYPWIIDKLGGLIVNLGGTSGQLGVDPEPKVFRNRDGVMIAPAICYESVYGEYFSSFTQKGATIMLVMTNDGWWGDTPGYRQHFSFARLRAIETRRDVARSANTGISGFINQRGDVGQTLRWDKRGVLNETVAQNSKLTFYTKHGDFVARIACIVFFVGIAYVIVSTQISKRRDGKKR